MAARITVDAFQTELTKARPLPSVEAIIKAKSPPIAKYPAIPPNKSQPVGVATCFSQSCHGSYLNYDDQNQQHNCCWLHRAIVE